MMNYKKAAAGLMAVAMTAGLTACGGDGSADETTVTTTTQATVEINTAELSEEDAQKVADVADLLTGELENKTIKWFSFYDPFHATTSGNTKAISLELFEEKYGGEIEYIQTTWANRFNDLSTKIVGGEGIDFIAGGDLDSFPKGVTNGMFEPVDEYVDYDSELWSNVKSLNDYFELNGKHYLIATQATTDRLLNPSVLMILPISLKQAIGTGIHSRTASLNTAITTTNATVLTVGSMNSLLCLPAVFRLLSLRTVSLFTISTTLTLNAL